MSKSDFFLLKKWEYKFKKRFRSLCKIPAVALVTTGMEKGGLEQIILDLYRGYKARGYRAYIVCQHWMFDSIKDLLDVPEDIFVFNNDLMMLIQFLWRRDIRTVHYHYNIFGIKELRRLGFKIIYTMHNTYTWMSDQQIKEYAEVLAYADVVVPVSESVHQYFLERSGNRKVHYQVIPNGVDFSILDNDVEPLPYTRDSLGIKEGQVTIAMVGSFYHAKHQIGMLGVAERLIQKYPQAVLIFLGNRGDENYYQRFMAELNNCQAREHIIMAPPIEHKLMGRFYREIVDIFVLPTLHEGNPLVAIEAMHCGCPMVLTPIGISDELKQKAACIICEATYDDLTLVTDDDIKNHLSLEKHARNESSIAECIGEIIDHCEQYELMAKERAPNADCYSIDRMIDGYVDLIKK